MSAHLDVLIIVDSESDASLIAEELRDGGYDPFYERVGTRDATVAALESRHWEIIIADYKLLLFSGLEALKLVRERDPDVPFIIFSEETADDIVMTALRAGVQEYIRKDNRARLVPAVQREMREAEVRKERRKAEESLRESEERFRTLFETMPVGVVYYDHEGRTTSANSAARTIFGMLPDQPVGMNPLDRPGRIIHVDGSDFSYDTRPTPLALATGQPVRNVVMGVYDQVENRYHWVLANAVPQFRPGESKPYQVFATYDDITESVEAHRLSENLAAINSRMISTLDSDEIMRSALMEASRAVDAETSAVCRRDGERWVVRYTYGADGVLGSSFLESEVPFLAQLAQTKKPVAIEDAYTDERTNHEIQRRCNIRAVLAAPLIVKEEVIGVFLFGFSHIVRFSQNYVDFVDRLGSSVSMALTNAWLYERVVQVSRRVTAMESIAEAGISALDMGHLLNTLVDRIAISMDAHSCTILMLDEETGELIARAAHNIPEECGFRLNANEGFFGKIIREKNTVYIRDAQDDPLTVNPHLKATGARSLLGTPLVVRGKLLGVIYIGTISIREYSEEEIGLFQLLATRAALIVENADLYGKLVQSRKGAQDALERELHFSRMLQRALIPIIPTAVRGYAVGSTYIPAFVTREIGGDFYDLFETEDGKIGAMIGDVSGKGLEAAAFAAECRSTIHAFAYATSSASEALNRANALLSAGEEAFGLFATVFIVIIDPNSGDFRYASAGHPPAVMCYTDGSVEFLSFGNIPVGLFPGFQFSESKAHLDWGEKIMLYTDGITEARRDSLQFGDEGIVCTLKEFGFSPPDELISRVVGSATDWANGHLRDDTAVLVIERCVAGD